MFLTKSLAMAEMEGVVAGCWDSFSSAVVGGLARLYITLEVGGLRLYISWISWDLLTLFCKDMIT